MKRGSSANDYLPSEFGSGERRCVELRRLTERNRSCGDPRFVDRVMAAVLRSELDWGRMMTRAAWRCVGVCGVLVLLAVWWAAQSRELVAFAYMATADPLESVW